MGKNVHPEKKFFPLLYSDKFLEEKRDLKISLNFCSFPLIWVRGLIVIL